MYSGCLGVYPLGGPIAAESDIMVVVGEGGPGVDAGIHRKSSSAFKLFKHQPNPACINPDSKPLKNIPLVTVLL